MMPDIRRPPPMHAAIVLLILILTYIGMAAGRIAWLRVDRTGIALLAVIALLASGEMTLDDFGSAVDLPTLALLFAMMIISAQFAESGFIDLCARTITEHARRHGGAAGADRRDRRRAVGGARQRHPDHRDRAAADRRGAAPRPRPAAVRDRAGRRDQCGLGRDADRQPAEHPAGRDRPPRFLAVSRDQRRAGAVRAGRRVQRRLAAMAPPHPPAAMPRRRRDRDAAAGDRRTRSTATRRSRAASRCWRC